MAPQGTQIKAVFFDFMGTCLDWHSSVAKTLPASFPPSLISQFALEWRRRYFIENASCVRQNLEPEDIDITLSRTLEGLLDEFPDQKGLFDAALKQKLVAAWHSQHAWPEVQDAISKICDDLGLEVMVHANGTTRLQLDLTRSSGLSFNMLFSSELLGVYKPTPAAYKRALDLVKLRPEQVVLVAAHAYDLRGAQAVGIKTVYVRRWTDDVDEDMDMVRHEFDAYLESMDNLASTIAEL